MYKLNSTGDRYLTSLKVSEEHGMISSLVHIGQFITDCGSILPEEELLGKQSHNLSVEELKEDLDVDEDTVLELQEVCSPESLACEMESKILTWEEITSVPSDLQLMTLEYWKEVLHKRVHQGKHNYIYKSKYNELDCALRAHADSIKAKDDTDMVTYPDTLTTVCVNFPRNNRRNKSCGVDFLVLGSQKLSELRDVIPCALDHQPVGDFTENPNFPTSVTLRDICPSSTFLIENIFFNDYRSPTNIDICAEVRKWANECDTIVPKNCEVSDMDKVTINDLKLRVGCPYMFLHQGDCEHIVVFKDIRLLSKNDCQSRSSYPVKLSNARFKTLFCHLCNVYAAQWLTRFDKLSEEDPGFFCDSCFRTLHYDLKGNKLDDSFIAFPYINLSALDY